jgi:hypothetical protein
VLIPFGTLSPDVTPQGLIDALKQAVATDAPDARWAPDGQPRVVASATIGDGAAAMYGGAGNLTRAGVSGRVGASIGPAGAAFLCQTQASGEGCGVGLSPAGATMYMRPYWDSRYPQWTTMWRLDLALADGLVLEVYADASTPRNHPSLGPVLTQSEIVRVVEDVARRITDR